MAMTKQFVVQTQQFIYYFMGWKHCFCLIGTLELAGTQYLQLIVIFLSIFTHEQWENAYCCFVNYQTQDDSTGQILDFKQEGPIACVMFHHCNVSISHNPEVFSNPNWAIDCHSLAISINDHPLTMGQSMSLCCQ